MRSEYPQAAQSYLQMLQVEDGRPADGASSGSQTSWQPLVMKAKISQQQQFYRLKGYGKKGNCHALQKKTGDVLACREKCMRKIKCVRYGLCDGMQKVYDVATPVPGIKSVAKPDLRAAYRESNETLKTSYCQMADFSVS